MRTKSVLGLALAFGFSFALLSGSGMGATIFGENPGDDPSIDTLGDIGDEASVSEEDGGLSGDTSGRNEPTLRGFVFSTARFGAELVAAVGMLPITLTRLGFPAYFAFPAGALAQIIAFMGLGQFVAGREWI